MRTLYLILYIIAAVAFIAAAVLAYRPVADRDGDGVVHTAGRVNLVALGLFAWVLVPLIQTARTLG